MNNKLLLTSAFVIVLMCSCTDKKDIKPGDIIFCGYESGELTKAIDEVTQTDIESHYSHMGIAGMKGDSIYIIHATSDRGVVKEDLNSFIINGAPAQVDVYRLKEEYNEIIPSALMAAEKLVGMPYNNHYRMSDTCYYCSQLVYGIFKMAKVFTLEPMTFKNPNSREYNPGWIDHYNMLGMEIPEGELGCNPNGLAASENIEFVFRLK